MKWKGYHNSLTWIDKKDSTKISQYFPKPYKCYSGNVKVELHLSNYATKDNLKGAVADTSNLAVKLNLTRVKPGVEEIDVDKLKTIPGDLRKLSNVVDNDVIIYCYFWLIFISK